MADLLGNEFQDLFVLNDSKIELSRKASSLILNQGAIYLWPDAMVQSYQSGELVQELKFWQKKVVSWKRSKSRTGEPLPEFLASLGVPEHDDDSVLRPYQFVTRDTIIERLDTKGVLSSYKKSSYHSIVSRIQSELTEYSFLTLLLKPAGTRPAVYKINYPFEPLEPKVNTLEIVETITVPIERMSKLPEEQRDNQIIQKARQLASRARPHDTHSDGKPIKDFTGIASIRSAGKDAVLKFHAQTKAGDDVAVMSKFDEAVYNYLVFWCLEEIRERFKLGRPLRDWFIITPEDIRDHINHPNLNLDKVRDMMIRWKDTELTVAKIEEIDDDSTEFEEFIEKITERPIKQFDDWEVQTKVLRGGKKVLSSMAFKLPEAVQAELERRVKNAGEETYAFGKIPRMLQVPGKKSLLSTSFGLALDSFIYNYAINYVQQEKGWNAELWAGLYEIFDDRPQPIDPSLPLKTRRSIADTERNRFMNGLATLFATFAEDPDEAMSTFKSIEGGRIELKIFKFTLIIELNNRKYRNVKQTGRVYILPTLKAMKHDGQSSLEQKLLESGLNKSLIKKSVNKFSEEDIYLIIRYVQEKKGVKNPPGYLSSLLQDLEAENVYSQLYVGNSSSSQSNDHDDRSWANTLNAAGRTYDHE